MKDNDTKERWREYFGKPLNENYVGDRRTRYDTLLVEQAFFHRIRVVEARKAMKQMKIENAIGPNDILIED